MKIGRAIGTALVGLFFMLFLAVDLVLFGVVALDSIVITAMLVIGLVGGAVVGWLVGARERSSGRGHGCHREPAAAAATGGAGLTATASARLSQGQSESAGCRRHRIDDAVDLLVGGDQRRAEQQRVGVQRSAHDAAVVEHVVAHATSRSGRRAGRRPTSPPRPRT